MEIVRKATDISAGCIVNDRHIVQEQTTESVFKKRNIVLHSRKQLVDRWWVGHPASYFMELNGGWNNSCVSFLTKIRPAGGEAWQEAWQERRGKRKSVYFPAPNGEKRYFWFISCMKPHQRASSLMKLPRKEKKKYRDYIPRGCLQM